MNKKRTVQQEKNNEITQLNVGNLYDIVKNVKT